MAGTGQTEGAMRYVKWGFLLGLALIVIAFLDYTLPSHQVVRVVGVTSQRIDMGINGWFFASPDAGTKGSNAPGQGRDIKFIQTVKPNGEPMVFRNEDTGWGWPPYFKFDTFNLQTRAQELVSKTDQPVWAMVTFYGWRSQLLTIFPNALSIRKVSGPDVTVFPWTSVIVLALLALLLLFIRRWWIRFQRRRVAPVLADVADVLDEADDRAKGFWRRFGGR
ncbi:DUF1523 family protein [Solirhodobacter olei]|uniref:DUF1523 family protein n=1 Tax=Solirhodobacter olei TaxID=2493082 RepID=UPI001F4E191E|nr:DUF1523 family protein [Solirhodobacter olei]